MSTASMRPAFGSSSHSRLGSASLRSSRRMAPQRTNANLRVLLRGREMTTPQTAVCCPRCSCVFNFHGHEVEFEGLPAPSMSVGGLQGGLEPSADAATGRGGAAGAAGAAQDTFMIDDASISMIDRIDQAIYNFQDDFGLFLESEGHSRAGNQMRAVDARSSVSKAFFGQAAEDDRDKSFLYQQLSLLLSKMVAVLARAQSATSLAMEARRRVLETELIRSQSLKNDHQHLLSELSARNTEARKEEAEKEKAEEKSQDLYNWPTAALPPSAAPVDDLVADHMQLRQAHSDLQSKCEMLEQEIARHVEEAEVSKENAAAAVAEALAATTSANGNAGNQNSTHDDGNGSSKDGNAVTAASSTPPASADTATNAVAAANSRPATATSRSSRPPSAKDVQQAAAAAKAWADVESLLDATEADARRVELSPTPVQVAIGSLSLREMRGTFGSRASSASSTRSSQQKQRPQSRGGGSSGGRRGHNNPNHPVEAMATLDWSGDPQARRKGGGGGGEGRNRIVPPSHDALTFGDLLHREQRKDRRRGSGALPRVGRR